MVWLTMPFLNPFDLAFKYQIEGFHITVCTHMPLVQPCCEQVVSVSIPLNVDELEVDMLSRALLQV